MNYQDFTEAHEQMLDEYLEELDVYPDEMGDVAHGVMSEDSMSCIAQADNSSYYPTEVFKLDDGWIAIDVSGFQYSKDGDSFTGEASNWRKWE